MGSKEKMKNEKSSFCYSIMEVLRREVLGWQAVRDLWVMLIRVQTCSKQDV